MGWETGPFHMYIEEHKAYLLWDNLKSLSHRDMMMAHYIVDFINVKDDGSIRLRVWKNRFSGDNDLFWKWFFDEYTSLIWTDEWIDITNPFECIKYKFMYQR
jgi:hypothetical protein